MKQHVHQEKELLRVVVDAQHLHASYRDADLFSQVFTADGRLISGVLTCLDKQGNIVLQHAAQHLEPSREERHLGTVIVPRDQRTKTQAMVGQFRP